MTSQKAILAILTALAIASLVFLKIAVLGGGLAIPIGGAQTTTTVISVGDTSVTSGTSSASSGGSNLNYSKVPSIFVSAEAPNGTVIPGVFTALVHNGTTLATAYTPVIFEVPSGQNYHVIVSDSKSHYFNHWSDGFSSRVIPIISTSSEISLKAVFTSTPQAPPPTPYSISTSSGMLNGGNLTGILVDVRVDGYPIQSGYTPVTFNNLEPGIQYQVIVFWYGDDYFRHFADGDLNRYELVTFNNTGTQSESYTALFQTVPSSEAASLDVIAKFANGTVIGTSFNATTYIQHTPGVWTTVTPQGLFTPYTGSDTGGSLLPFILMAGQNYTVEMSNWQGYHFAKWADTGSTDPNRVVTLNSNMTLVAIYD